MKIVCESCSAKYSIADEKVAGKVFKIRCKRCSEVIIVRGDQDAAPPPQEASQAYNYAADAIWHVVVDGEQAGPYTPGQLGEMLTAGTIDWEAYVWAEGFDNWAPMRDVEDLVAQITGEAQQQQPADAYGSAGADTLAAQPSMGADPFADEPAPSEQGLFGDQPAAGAGPDLFGGDVGGGYAAAPAAAPDPGVVSSSPSPRVSGEQAMTGARNENSVLFSLKNLQALATGSSSQSIPPGGDFSASPGTGDRAGAGMAAGEGSGLIDIRALASTTGMGGEADSGGEKDELLSMGAQGGAFGALGSPMLAPSATDEGDGNKKAIIWAAVAGVGLLSLAGVAVAFIMRPVESAPQPVVAAAPAPSVAAAAAAANPAPAKPTKAEGDEDEAAPSEGAAAAAKAAEQAEQAKEAEDKKPSKKKTTSRRSRKSSSAKSSASDEPSSPSPTPARKAPAAKPSGPRSIDDLLDSALSGKKPAKAAPAKADANLPKTPNRDDVIKAMGGVRSAVSACAGGQSGVATVQVTVAGSTGRVTNAQVSGVTGPPGSCIAKAVRKAKFPKFSQKVFKVKFPFKL